MNVIYIDHMGSDLTATNAARVSFNAHSDSLTPRDEKLIHYLAEHQHMSPFEHMSITVLVEAPKFIAAQWMRHRSFSYNEVSRRYTSESLTYWTPPSFRKQSVSNRQASDGPLLPEQQDTAKALLEDAYESAQATYDALIAMGVCREQARSALPQGINTKFYCSGTLRAWAHFIKLRDHEGAQKEIQELARQCKEILVSRFPVSAAALLGGTA